MGFLWGDLGFWHWGLHRCHKFALLLGFDEGEDDPNRTRWPRNCGLCVLFGVLLLGAPRKACPLTPQLLPTPLRSLQRPLESLELPFCHLQPCDLTFLAHSPHASALKKLDLSGNDLSSSLLPSFLHLLPAVSSSLRHLDVAECHLGDAHLPVLLPPLRRCALLSYLGLFGNALSSKGLKVLLEGTLPLTSLRLVVHPYPIDCHGDDGDGDVPEGRVAAVRDELRGMLRSAGRDEEMWTSSLHHHGGFDFFVL